MKNQGYDNELKLIEMIDGKAYNQINKKIQHVLDFVYENNQDDDIFYASKYEFHAKPDIKLQKNQQDKYLSVKTGKSKFLHSEGIKPFILFLRSIGISEYAQKTILMFHYGDGTLNGSGRKRYNFDDVLRKLENEIAETNKELNRPDIVLKIVDRFIFDGSKNTDVKSADCLVHLSKEVYFANREEIKEFIVTHDFSAIKTLHFGPITIRPYVRNVNRKNLEYKREIVQANLSDVEGMLRQIRREKGQ